LTVSYRDSDIAGLDETKLAMCRYDAVNDLWIELPSTVDAANNLITATVNHLSTFALVQFAPAAGLDAVKAYPVPFNPNSGAMTIENLTATADIKIFTVAGELVRTVDYLSANGRATWDGRNNGGSKVASGVYILYIKSADAKKRVKIAVEK
jgi:hypothetical protein